jgi:hypothetical protein
MGTHAELLEDKGHYYKLYTEQFRRQLEQELDPFQQDYLPAWYSPSLSSPRYGNNLKGCATTKCYF